VPAPALAVELALGVGEADVQAAPMSPMTASIATRRNGIRGSVGDAGKRCAGGDGCRPRPLD
jgi:hypothetical protein